MTLEEIQGVADRLLSAQFNHQRSGGGDNIYGLAFKAIKELGDKVHGEGAIKATPCPELRRFCLRVVE